MSASTLTPSSPTNALVIKRVLPHQWPLLERAFAANGHTLPPWTQLPCYAAFDGERVVGVILAHRWSVELELWVDDEHREQGLAGALATAMQPDMEQLKPFTAYARNDASAALCVRFGLLPIDGVLFTSEV